MFSAEKRVKLSNQSINNNNANKFSSANSTDLGIGSDEASLDFTDGDFSLPQVKRRTSVARKVSFSKNNKQSLESLDAHHTSSGYYSSSSLLSSTVSNRSCDHRTPTKRKLDDHDENASPHKIRKKKPSEFNPAKRILKEKSSSENVLRSSTPIRGNTGSLRFGKTKSLHPHKFEHQKTLEEIEPFEKPSALPTCSEISFDVSGLDFTTSFDQTSSAEHHDSNIPPQFQQLMTKSLVGTTAQPKPVESQNCVPVLSSTSSTFLSSHKRRSYIGREEFDILGKLDRSKDYALNKIFSYISDHDLICLSHVSKDYRRMISSHKTAELRRLNYLNTLHQNLENKLPDGSFRKITKSKINDRKRVFGETNVNHSMQLRSSTPPTSPSRKRLQENRNIEQTPQNVVIKCPSCQKMTAKIKSIVIRSSPRKKKKKRNTSNSILKISTGRIQKHSRTFLDKPSIDSQCSSELIVSFPELEDHTVSSSASSSGSPSSPSSEDSSGNEQSSDVEEYKYAECSGRGCRFKFCTSCKERSHPRQKCKELAPASPSRGFSFDSSGNSIKRNAKSSKKSLKRLIDIY